MMFLYKIEPSRYRLYDAATDPAPITADTRGRRGSSGVSPIEEPDGGDEVDKIFGEFAYERDLRNYLAKNLSRVESGLRLYEDEDITGIEFPAGGRFIDILAVSDNNEYVVVELKVSRGYDRVVGQILRYIAWIEQSHADAGQRVRGIIVAREISEDLKLACSRVTDVALYEYDLQVKVRAVPLAHQTQTHADGHKRLQ